MYEFACLFSEESNVGRKRGPTRTKRLPGRFSNLSGERILKSPTICSIRNEHTGQRPVSVSDMLKKREKHGNDNPFLHT